MKAIYITSLVLSALIMGCGEKQDTQNKPAATNVSKVGENPLNAPSDYVGTMLKAQQSANKVVDLASITKAIDMFNAQEERFPKDLNELVTKKYLPSLPPLPPGSRFDYNPKTGVLKIVKVQ